MTKIFATASLVLLLTAGAASAQATAPAPSGTPAATAAAPATGAPAMNKMAKSKECSAEADKQGLHGKARKHFRSQCKSGKV